MIFSVFHSRANSHRSLSSSIFMMLRRARRAPRTAGATAVLLLCAAVCLSGCGGSSQPPSIIVITVDTLRADHLSCYGYFRRTSPFIDSLAADGVLFESVMAPMASTLPSHLTLFTSMLPIHHGIQGNFHSFHIPFVSRNGIQTAAQLFKRKGYTTAAFVSATPLCRLTGISAGFDVFDETKRPERPARETMDRALIWLGSQPAPPVFLWVHLFDPALYTPPRIGNSIPTIQQGELKTALPHSRGIDTGQNQVRIRDSMESKRGEGEVWVEVPAIRRSPSRKSPGHPRTRSAPRPQAAFAASSSTSSLRIRPQPLPPATPDSSFRSA